MQQAYPIVFLHVPKCGGSSIVKALFTAIKCQSPLTGFDRTLFGDFTDFVSIETAVGQLIHVGDLPAGDHDAGGGHMGYRQLRKRFPRCRFMTILREPRIRLISRYLFWRSFSDEELAPWGTCAPRIKLVRKGFHAFVTAKDVASNTDNMISRFLVSPRKGVPTGNIISEKDHAAVHRAASEVLSTLEFVDCLENKALQQRLSAWTEADFEMAHDNPTRRLNARIYNELLNDLEGRSAARFERLSAIDLELWKKAGQRFNPFDDGLTAANRALADYKLKLERLGSLHGEQS